MISANRKKRGLCLPFVFFICLAATANAQWAMVDSGGMPISMTSDGKYIYVGFHGGYYHPGDTAAPRQIIRSSDSGTTWENVSKGLTSGSMYSVNVASLCAAGNNVFAGTDNGIFISSDHGDNWVQANFDPITHGWTTNALFAVDSLIFAGTVDQSISQPTMPGIFVSSDNGQSWARSDSGIRYYSGAYPSIYCFARIGSTIFAGNADAGVFSSTNDGKSWTWDSLGITPISFAVIDSTLLTCNGRVWRSSHMGTTWTAGPAIGARYLAASGSNLIAGRNSLGVCFSSDMGDSWKPVNAGLDSNSLLWPISSLAIIGDYVYAGTARVLYRRPLSEITSVERSVNAPPNTFELKQNYPNPFNPSTTISYHLPASSIVTLKVYDVLGREVATLVRGKQEVGVHLARFDASGRTSGVYFYRLAADGYTATKKMVLIK